MSRRHRIRAAGALIARRAGDRGRRAIHHLGPVMQRWPLPGVVVDAWIRHELTPPNGLVLRPDLVEAAARLHARAPDDETLRLYLRVLAEQRRAGLSVAAVAARAMTAVCGVQNSDLGADFVQQLIEQGDLQAARATVRSLPTEDARGASCGSPAGSVPTRRSSRCPDRVGLARSGRTTRTRSPATDAALRAPHRDRPPR